MTPAGLHHADFYCSTLEYHINKLTKTPVEVSREAFQAFRVEYEAEAHEAALSTGKHEVDDAPAEGAEGVAKKARTMMSNLFSFGGGASGGGADEGDDKHRCQSEEKHDESIDEFQVNIGESWPSHSGYESVQHGGQGAC